VYQSFGISFDPIPLTLKSISSYKNHKNFAILTPPEHPNCDDLDETSVIKPNPEVSFYAIL